MCGIVAIYNFNNHKVEKNNLEKMLKIIKHRGPDDDGFYIDNNIGLGHVRLSVIDVSELGHQPMISLDERYVIVFNGEIYNYIELREQLRSLYDFQTNSDTEVIIAAYHVWGKECLNKFNGDWSFILYDNLKKETFCARDRYGVKPFYYYLDNNRMLIGSEIKAILPFVEIEPNDNIIFDYISFNRTDHTDETFFKKIKKLKPGHSILIKDNKAFFEMWYDLKNQLQEPFINPTEYRTAFKKAINLRLRSDVAVGLSLSGGIDSSAITSVVISDFSRTEIQTFSAIYKNTSADESEFIEAYTEDIKNMHFTSPNSHCFYNEFRDFIETQGEPVASIGPYAQYKVMQLAKGKIVVSLDGQGADEQLAGYHYFFGTYFKELLVSGKLRTLSTEFICYLFKHKSILGLKYLIFYCLPSSIQQKIGGKILGSINPKFYNKQKSQSRIANQLLNPSSLNASLLEHFEYKLQHLLKWGDLNSMRFSIESRVPFLDHNLVERTLNSHPGMKINKGDTKFILRESMKDILPKKIYERKDKKGFSTPSDDWFRTIEFQEYIWAMLNSEKFKERAYFNVSKCKSMYKDHLSGNKNISKEIWKWINIDEWCKLYID